MGGVPPLALASSNYLAKKALPTSLPIPLSQAERREGASWAAWQLLFGPHWCLPDTFTYPSDLAGLAVQWPLASRSSPGSQLALEILEGLSAQAGLSFQLMQGDLYRLLDLSFQDVLNQYRREHRTAVK